MKEIRPFFLCTDVCLDDLDVLIGYLQLVKPVLIGWPMGAAIGIIYAVTRQDVLSKLAIAGGTSPIVDRFWNSLT